MSKTKYPNTAKVAMNVAKAVADSRKEYRQFDADAAAFGLPVAMFNAGFIAGQDHERGKKKARTESCR
jgi:hypothetical protein